MTATLPAAPSTGKLPALAAPIACGCCLAAGAAYIVAANPSDGGVFLPCPFRTLTGWWCPGCGLTRATHHLLRADVAQALRYNLFVVVILTALAATWLAWTVHAAGRSVRQTVRVPVWAQVSAVSLLLAFAVVRNFVPGLRG